MFQKILQRSKTSLLVAAFFAICASIPSPIWADGTITPPSGSEINRAGYKLVGGEKERNDKEQVFHATVMASYEDSGGLIWTSTMELKSKPAPYKQGDHRLPPLAMNSIKVGDSHTRLHVDFPDKDEIILRVERPVEIKNETWVLDGEKSLAEISTSITRTTHPNSKNVFTVNQEQGTFTYTTVR